MKYALITIGFAGALGLMVYVSGGTQSFMANMLSTQGSREEVFDVNATTSMATNKADVAPTIAPKKTSSKKSAAKKSAPMRTITEAIKENTTVITASTSAPMPVITVSAPSVATPPAPIIPVVPVTQPSVTVATATTSMTPLVVSAPPIASTSVAVTANIGAVLISEVMTGIKGQANYDFIELYNTGDMPVVLTGWTIKKRTSSGNEDGLVAATRLKDRSIPAHGFLLLANGTGYTGSPTADIVWPDSYSLAAEKNSIALYKTGGVVADEVAWQAIPDGQSLVRDAWDVAAYHVSPMPTPGSANVQ